MKKHYLKTGNKKVMSAVLLAATMMVGLAACGGGNDAANESTPENSAVESTVENSEENSAEESSVEESTEETSEESTEADDLQEENQTRTYVYEVDGVENEYVETLFESADGYSIWYPADMLETAEVLGHEGFVQVEVPEGTGASFMMVLADASLDVDVMLKEATSNYGGDDTYEEIAIGDVMELESDMVIKYIDVVHDETADRFYAISDGENIMLITVTASAEELEDMSVYFNRMAQTVEFQAVKEDPEAEESGTVESGESADEESAEDGDSTNTAEGEVSGTEAAE